MKFSFCLLLLFVREVLSEKCIKILGRNCQCQWGSRIISLEKYATEPKFVEVKPNSATDNSRYSYNPCVPQPHPSGVQTDCEGAAIWQKTADNSHYPVGTFTKFDFLGEPEKGNLRINYTANTRTSVVYLKCKKSGPITLDAFGETSSGSKVYNFTLNIPEVCVSSTGGGGGLSPGSILLIVFFVLVLIYIIGGMLYLRFAHGARGVEQIPNYDFWIDFPLLVRDGVVFLSRGCKPEPTYQQI